MLGFCLQPPKKCCSLDSSKMLKAHLSYHVGPQDILHFAQSVSVNLQLRNPYQSTSSITWLLVWLLCWDLLMFGFQLPVLISPWCLSLLTLSLALTLVGRWINQGFCYLYTVILPSGVLSWDQRSIIYLWFAWRQLVTIFPSCSTQSICPEPVACDAIHFHNIARSYKNQYILI